MRYCEAKDMEAKMADDPNIKAEVVRILPEHIDPIKAGDNGWDVEYIVLDGLKSYRTPVGGL
jgi:hypothetical protein